MNKKNLRTRRGNIATETLFFSLLGVQTRERCSVGTKIYTMEARMFIDLIQYYFFPVLEMNLRPRILFSARLNWETFCRKKVHQLIAMQAVEIQKMTIIREDEKKES